MRVSTMQRPTALKAASIREARGLRELLVANFWKRLADGLPDDDVTVGEHYTPEQVEAIWREIVDPDDDDDGSNPLPQLPSP